MRLFIPFFLITNFLCSSPFIWVTNSDSHTVSVIDGATNQLVTSISQIEGMFSTPTPIAFLPNGRFAYIGNWGDSPNTVSVIDSSSYQLVTSINLGLMGSQPYAIAASPNGELVMVTNAGANAVSVISTETNTVIETLIIGGPLGIAFSKDGAHAYVSQSNANSIAVIDTAALTFSVPAGFNGTVTEPDQIAVSSDGTYAYAGRTNAAEIWKLDLLTNTVNGTIALPAGSTPEGIAFSLDGSIAYVVDSTNYAVDIIDTSTSTVTTVINTATGMFSVPQYVAVGPNQRFYVNNLLNFSLSVLSTETNELVQSISSMEGNFLYPSQLAIQPENSVERADQRAYQRPSNRRPR